MASANRIDQVPVRLNTKITEERQTPKTDFGSRMKDGLSVTAGAIAQGAAVAAPLVPGGAIISAAVSGVNQLGGSLSSGQRVGSGAIGGATPQRAMGGSSGAMGSTGTPGTSTIPNGDTYSQGMSLLEAQQASNMQFLMLQSNMQMENQQFSSLSNVMKVRHDTAKNSISNIR